MDTPLIWTAKTRKIKTLLDKQIEFAPHVKTFYLKDQEYQQILALIPGHYKKYGFDGTPVYRDRIIKLWQSIRSAIDSEVEETLK